VKLIRTLPASVLNSIASALESGRLKPPFSAFGMAEWVPPSVRESLAAELYALFGAGFTPATLAITLKIIADDIVVRQRALDHVQLVWTSPDEGGPHVRDTSVVVRQLSSEARHSLWISSFGIFNGQDVFLPVHEALLHWPDLQIVLILNIPSDHKNFLYGEAAIGRYASLFWKYQWPWESKPAVYYDPRGSEEHRDAPACQHAKCILVDDDTAFITSANFTEAAHERNIELGVLFRHNPMIALSIKAKFESLIRNGFLQRLI
jgi:phosphatidylserine/phosphatidylglycerophosphate/cardiolipin synthase-like enzyme